MDWRYGDRSKSPPIAPVPPPRVANKRRALFITKYYFWFVENGSRSKIILDSGFL